MAISLAAARVNAELTQDDVCKALNISKSTLVSYEAYNTSPDIGRANQLAELYGCEVSDIRWTKK